MFGFIKKCFYTAMIFFACNVLSVNSLECVLMKNQECKITRDNVLLDPRQRMFNHLNNLIFEKVNFGPKI